MSNFSEYIPLASNQSSLSLDTPVTPNVPSPDAFISPIGNNPPVIDNSQSSFGNYIDAPTLQEKLAPTQFDWNKTQADRFTQSKYFTTKGFDPYAGYETIDGKSYDVNELKYAGAQTWGDVMSNAFGGSLALAKNTFVEGWKGWANMANAFTNWNSDETFMQRLAGSPEELMQKDEEQKAIFNKYAIFKSPVKDTGFGVFNREFVGDMVQQSGFSLGAGAQFLSEMALTWGIGEGFGAVAKSAGWLAKGLSATEEGAETLNMLQKTNQLASKGKVINDARKIADPTAIKGYGERVLSWVGEQVTDVTGIGKMAEAYGAGASKYQLAAMGVGGITRFGAALNTAATEARFEAANTYGQMYGSFLNDWQEKNNGQLPVGNDLERIRKTSYAAATDVFVANTALLLAFNQLEFGNIINKFGSSSRLMREALEQGESELFSVTGKLKRDIASTAGGAGLKEGQKATQAYLKGRLGALSNFNTIRKDFGLGTALWQVGKRSQATKLQIGEGLQEILQNTTDVTFTDYYKNLYDGGKDIDGNSFVKDLTSADWGKGLQAQLSMEGWQTFLMGAATGLFITPVQSAAMTGFKKANASINKQYQGEVDAHKKIMKANLDILNTWYTDPTKALNEHINGIKVQGKADKNMQAALQGNDRYEFHNAKDDAFASAVSVAIKTGNYESFVDSITELGERLTDEQFEQAFGLKKTSSTKTSARAFTQSIVKDIEKYHDNWENLKDKFAYLIQPELYAKDSKDYQNAKVAKKILDDAIEVLATTSHHAERTLERAAELRAKAAAIPGIGASANKSFDVLSSSFNASVELNRLKDELTNLEGLTKDATITEQIKNNKEQQKHLEQWFVLHTILDELKGMKTAPDLTELQENMKNSFTGYISAVNTQYDKTAPTLDKNEVNEVFGYLIDFNTLNKDNGHYVAALNVLSDPKNFALMYQKMKEGAEAAKEKIKKEHVKEAKNRTAASTGTEVEEDEQEQEQEDEDKESELPVPDEVLQNLISYYGQDEYIASPSGGYTSNPKRVLSEDAENWLKENGELENKLDTAYNNAKRGVLSSTEVEAIIKEHFTKEEPETDEQKAERLAKEKAIALAAEKKRLQAQWNKELQENRKKYPHTPQKPLSDADLALREKNEKEINAKYTKLIADLDAQLVTPVPGATGIEELVLTPEEEKAIGATKKDGKWYLDGKFDKPVEEGYIREQLAAYNLAIGKGDDVSDIDAQRADIEKREQEELKSLTGVKKISKGETSYAWRASDGTTVFTYDDIDSEEKVKDIIKDKYKAKLAALEQQGPGAKTSLEGLPKMQILDSQVSVAAHRLEDIKTGKYVDTVEQAEQRLANTLSSLSQADLDEGLSIIVTERPAGQAKAAIPGNEVVYIKPQKYSIQLRYKNQPIGYLTNAGFYVFKIDGQELNALDLSVEQFEKLMEIPKGMTAQEALEKFQEDYKVASAIQIAIEKHLANGKNTFSGTELQDLLSIKPVITLDFVDGSRPAPKLSELETSVEIPVNEAGERKMIVVNNARYKETIEKLQATGEITDTSASEFAPMILGEMSDLDSPAIKAAGPIPVSNNMGMYSVAIQVAGQVRWIQLTPTLYSEAEMQTTLNRITELTSKESRTDDENNEISTLLRGIFIALPVYTTVEKNGKVQKVKDPKQDWTFDLYYSPANNTIGVKTNKKSAALLTLGTAKFANAEELAEAIQKEISKVKKGKELFPGITITKENFRHQVPFTGSIEQKKSDVMNMTASVYPNVAQRISLRYGLPIEKPETTIPTESEPGIPNNVQPTDVSETTKKGRTKKAVKEKNAEAINKAVNDGDFEALEAETKRGGKAKKVVPKGKVFDEKSVENIQKFVAWVKKNLPEGIFSVEDLSRLENAMYDNYITVGQFVGYLNDLKKIKGEIQVTETSPFKYHEAFHGIFRLLLSQDKIDQLFAQVRKEVKVTAQQLKELKESDPIYMNMSDAELKERFYEEYMADKFDAWKMNRSTPVPGTLKAFFQKLFDFIKELFARISGNRLEAMFYEIERGKYKKAGLQVNSFTNKIQEGISDPALKLIKIEEGVEIETENGIKIVDRYYPQTKGDQLSSNIAALFHRMVQQESEHNKKELLNKILNIYAATYDTSLPIYKKRALAIEDVSKRAQWMGELIDLKKAVTDKDARASLMEAVDLHLHIMGYRQELDDESTVSLENEVGARNTENAHQKNKSPLSDYASLSKYLREYIGSTTYQLNKDEFGNTSLVGGIPIYNTVSANKVYNGMLAILSNIANEETMIERMVEYTKHQGNPETTKFLNRLFEDVDFDFDTMTPRKNSQYLQQVIKGFNQYSTQYLFTRVTQDNKYQTSYANTKDAAKIQFSNWRDQYESLKTVKIFSVRKLIDKMSNNETKISNTDLDKFAESVSKSLEKETGIALHEMFIKFSIIASKKEEARTKEQQKFYNLYSTVEPILPSALSANLESPLSKGANPFARDIVIENGEEVEIEKINTSKPYQFLIKIAAANALFDETINTISFTNANNETVYAHQLPNFDFIRARELNDPAIRETLARNPEFGNFLLSDRKFITLANRNKISIEQIDGLRKVFESFNQETGESFISNTLEVNRQPGITFGDYNKREFLATLLGFYDVRNQPDAVVRNDSNTEKWYVVPVMTRTIEAKNSAHLMRMAVIPSVTKVNGTMKLSQPAMDKLYEFVVTELKNIRRAKKEIEEINNGTFTGKVLQGYHTGKKNTDGSWKVEPRGLKFFNMRLALGDLAEQIEVDPDAELNETKVKDQLNRYWLSQADSLATEMALEGLISLKKEGGKVTKISNILAPNFIFEGYRNQEMNEGMNIVSNDPMFNIAQIMVNDFINTVAINQLMLGNEAKAFKDPIDQVKRMAGANAQGPSMKTSFTATDLGINHALPTISHITYSDFEGVVKSSVSGSDIQSDDGQMYGTAKGLRYALFGFGKLTKLQADIITKLEEGVDVTEKEFFEAGGLKDTGAFNSLKLVYYNGSTYLKCSMIPLFRGAVSIWDGNEWQPQIGKEAAHELLNKMEDYEKGYERNKDGKYILDENGQPKVVHAPTVVFAHPESVSKAMKANVASSIFDITDENFNQLDSRFMRQQLENPSNKIVITDPSQAKQQIMSEQDPNTPVIFMGVETTIGKVRAAYMADNSQRVKNNYNNVANSIFTLKDAMIELDKSIKDKQFTAKMGPFFDNMRETLRATGADQQTLAFLETKDGQPIYNLNFPSTLEKFTNIFLNYFSKGVVAEKIPGQTLALVSGALGMGDCLKRVISLDENGQPKEWEVIPRAEYLKNYRKYKDVKRWDDTTARTFVGLKEGDFYLDSLRHNVPIYDKDGKIVGRFSEYMAPAHYREEMNGIPHSLRDAFGIRIPSDDKHSYISLRKVDTLPVQYGSVGIFPHEIVEISGADFDIDKMYLSIADTYPVYDTESNAAVEYKQVKDRISSHYDRLTELERQFKSLSSYSESIAERAKEIKKEINKLTLQYEAGLIELDEYESTLFDLEEEKESLGTEEGKEERGPIIREMKMIGKEIKELKKKADSLKEKLDKNATRVAYGSRTSRQGEFDEFIKWQEQNNKVFKDKLKELRSLYVYNGDSFSNIDSDVIADIEDLNEMFNLDSDTLLYKTALNELGFPADPIEYYNACYDKNGNKIVELNNGVLNNRSLAAKLAMQSNEKTVEINSTSTSTKPLSDLTEKLIKMFTAISEDENIPYDKKRGVETILKVLQEKPTDVNSIMGKVIAFDNNKQGSRNIGATANAIQVYSLLNQFGVQMFDRFAITIDGNTFNSFSHNKEWEAHEAEPVLYKTGKKKGEIKGYIIAGEEFSKKDFDENNVPKGAYTGTRIAANLGTLLNAMTDNAKERLAARLGLNITALGYVSNMVGTGVPLETAVLIVLQPAARRYFADIQKLSGSLKTKDEEKTSKKKLLAERIESADPKGDVNVSETNTVTTQDLIDNIAQGGTKNMDAWALKVIEKMDVQSNMLSNISKIQKLSQGLPRTWEDVEDMNTALKNLGIKLDGDRYVPMTSDEYQKYAEENSMSIPLDVKDILLKDQEIIATNLKVLAQVQYLSKKVFIEKTPLFARLKEVTYGNMKEMSALEKEDFDQRLKQDLISFLSIKAYRHWLTSNDMPGTIMSLDNAMIYPEAKKNKPADYKDIIDILTDLREKLTGENENYLVTRFLMTVKADENKEGINTAEANTWARLSDAQQDKLVSSFISLYVNAYEDAEGNEINTHDAAIALFNYLLVKDGAQYRSGSFIRFIPTFMFQDIMDRTTEVNDFLSSDKWNEEKAVSIFGVPSVELMNDFVRSYGTHIANSFYVKRIADNKGRIVPDNVNRNELALTQEESKKLAEHAFSKPYTNPVDINPDGEPLIYIDIFRGIRDTIVPTMDGMYENRVFGKGYTDFEKALLTKNKSYIKASGFSLVREEIKGKPGKTHDVVEFPYTVKVGSDLYELYMVSESVDATPSRVIAKGDTVAKGTSAQYRKVEWTGAPSTFRAQGVFGVVPVSKIQPVSKKPKKFISEEEGDISEDEIAAIQAQQYEEQTEAQVSPEQRLAEFGIVRIAVSGGFVAVKGNKQYPLTMDENTPRKIIEKVQAEEAKEAASTQAPVTKQDVSLPGERMTDEQWDRILSNMGKGPAQKAEALAYRNEKRAEGKTDADILNKIKECL